MDIYTLRVRYLGLEASNQHRVYEESSERVIFTRGVVFDEEKEIIKVSNIEYVGTPPQPRNGVNAP